MPSLNQRRTGRAAPQSDDVQKKQIWRGNGSILALSFRSSTMLRMGAELRGFEGGKVSLNPCSLAWPGKTSGNGSSCEWTSGVGGCDSPNTTVLGRNSDAITTRWFLSELIVRICGKNQGEGMGRVTRVAAPRIHLFILGPFNAGDCRSVVSCLLSPPLRSCVQRSYTLS